MAAAIIAIANCKGGTGKSTTAVNLSAELAEAGRRVLLVDLDSQGHSGFGFGVTAGEAGSTVHQVFRETGYGLAPSIRPSGLERIDVLPADRGFTIPSGNAHPGSLAAALLPVLCRYDVVVIDTPPAADLPLVAALTAAHRVLVPTQLQYLAHDGLLQLSRLFFRIATEFNADLRSFAIVPIQIDMRMHIQQAILAKLLYDFGPERIFHGIRSDIALAEAFGSHRPVRHYRPSTRGAVDFHLLAKDVLSFWNV